MADLSTDESTHASGGEAPAHMPDAGDLEAILGEAVRRHREGDGGGAEARYRELLERHPDQPDALHFLGVLRHQQDRSDESIELIQRALEVAPGYVDAWNNLGNVYRAMGRIEEAGTAYRRAVELNDQHAGAWNNLAVILRARTQYQEAIAAHRRAIELMPIIGDWYYSYANTLREFGDATAALDAYRQALELNPGDRRSSVRVGYMLYLTGHREDAVRIFREWVAAEPDNAEAKHLLAACSGEGVPERASEEYVRRMFDTFSDSFDEHLLRQLDYRAPALVGEALGRLIPAAGGPLDILDTGCGTGLCAEHLRPYARTLSGVDLSPLMLEKARIRGGYDELHEAELTAFLESNPDSYDAVVSADTLVYIGDLNPVMRVARNALRSGGLLVFTTESGAGESYSIGPHGRYAHSEIYLRRVLANADFEVANIDSAQLRTEALRPVDGYVVSARASSPGSGRR